jgi:hypothetical protein
LGRGRPRFPPDITCPAVLTLMRHAATVSSPTGLSPAPVGCSNTVRLTPLLARRGCHPVPASRPTPTQQRRQPRTLDRFGLLPVRSPLLRESSLFLGVREMFQFPRFPPPPTWRSPVSGRGCPIRIPLDHRLPAPPQRVSSRGHVLHRPLAPRHPPCAHTRSCLPDRSFLLCFVVRAVTSVITTLAAPVAPLSILNCAAVTIRVEPRGLEPRTSAVQGRRSPS